MMDWGKDRDAESKQLLHIVRWFILQFGLNFKIYGFVKSIV
jgi:hypothetical protein